MKTNGVPAIIMLAAGFIDCVIAILTHMSLWNFTRQLLLVLVLFYVIGCVVKMIIDRNFKDMEDDQNGEETEESKEEQEAESSPAATGESGGLTASETAAGSAGTNDIGQNPNNAGIYIAAGAAAVVIAAVVVTVIVVRKRKYPKE